MTTNPTPAGGQPSGSDTVQILNQQEISLAVNGFLMANKAAVDGDERSLKDKQQHLRTIQNHYWRTFSAILSAAVSKRRSTLEFSDDERLFMDLGLVDIRMLDGERAHSAQLTRELLGEIKSKGLSGCYYLSEWLANRFQQLQLENDLSGGVEDSEDNSYESQLKEARRRVLSRLSAYFSGLPGIPLEVSESMRSGDLDKAIIASGIVALKEPKRKNFLRRHNLWVLREQILAKARARAGGQATLRLFEMLNEVYTRDWRARYDSFLNAEDMGEGRAGGTTVVQDNHSVSVSNPNLEILMSEGRQMRMRTVLVGAIDGKAEPDTVLHGRAPRLTKPELAAFLPVPQTFDRALAELPPIVIVPGSGRGFFAWETGCVLLALRPMVSLDDSVATAFAWLRMLDDRLNKGGVLRAAYEKRFPGAVFQNEFPADYRAWLTRLTKGDAAAMNPQRRVFFRDMIGPELNGPILPPNLRNVGPQTMVAICRRLERQVAAGDVDVNLHRRLAAIYWQQGNAEAAGLQFNAAMQMAPEDGETLFAAGMFMRGQGDGEAANDCFRWGAERASASMWGIYCQDALANLL